MSLFCYITAPSALYLLNQGPMIYIVDELMRLVLLSMMKFRGVVSV